MHILLLTTYFPPDVGSAAHLFYDLGCSLLAQGHTVSVITSFPSYHAHGDLSRFQGRRRLQETQAGMTVYRLAVPQIARDTPIGRGLWQFSSALAFGLAGLGGLRPDVTLVYSPPLPLALAALFWRWRRGIPYVVNVQDLFPQSAIDLGVLQHKPLISFFRWLERLTYRQADAVTVHTTGKREHVLACGGHPAPTRVVHNSVDTDELRPAAKENALRHELGLQGCFVASFAGVMGYSQDVDVILEAARLLQDYPDIRFLLVGDGVEKERLVQKSRAWQLDQVVWLPMQPREKYPAVVHASDVGLATLRADVKTPVVPSKILSIMAAGRPVVAALDLQGDAPRLVTAAQAGYCLAPGDARALADVLLRLYHDPALAERLGRNGRCYAENHLSPAAVAEQYTALFESLRPDARAVAQAAATGEPL